jgi:hypothetical protein
VIRYAGSFLPSWAGAISIDLLPGVLVAILAVAHSVMRRSDGDMDDAERITAADMLRALEIHETLSARRRAIEMGEQAEDDEKPAEAKPAPISAENVTPLSVADRKRNDT